MRKSDAQYKQLLGAFTDCGTPAYANFLLELLRELILKNNLDIFKVTERVMGILDFQGIRLGRERIINILGGTRKTSLDEIPRGNNVIPLGAIHH